MYLIWEKGLINFCNAINLGFEPSNVELNYIAQITGIDLYFGLLYLRNGDEHKIVNGFPELPEDYQSYLLPKPLVGKLLKVETQGNKTFAQINLGRRDGIKEKMQLYVEQKTDRRFTIFVVESVQENTSQAEGYSEVKLDDKVFTRYQGPRTRKELY